MSDTITLRPECLIARLERQGRVTAAEAAALREIQDAYASIIPDPAFIEWAVTAIRTRVIAAIPFTHAELARDVLVYRESLSRFEDTHRMKRGKAMEALRDIAGSWQGAQVRTARAAG